MLQRLTADSWVELAAARAENLECVVENVDVALGDLTVTDCQNGKRVKLDEVMRGHKTVLVLLRHFA